MNTAGADRGLLAGEQPDLRLLIPAAAAWLAAALALGWSSQAGLAITVGLVGLGTGALLGPRRTWAVVLAATALCAAGSTAAAAWRVAALQRGPLPALARAGVKVDLELVIGSDPRLLSVAVGTHGAVRSIVVVAAKAVEVTTLDGTTSAIRSPVFVLATGRGWLDLQPSQHVWATGRLGVPDPGELETATFDASGSPSAVGQASLVQRVAGHVRAGLRAATAPLPAGPGGLLPGLVDGDVSRLPPALTADFKTTGLTHLVAVSGANVAIVLGAVLVVARWLGLRLRGQAWAGALAIVAFVVVARPQPSVLRAAAMGLVAVLALSTGRRRRALPALAAAVLCLMYVDPALSRSIGFALSVLATGGLVVVAPGLRDRMARHMPRWLAEAISVPAAATLVCSPLIASISGTVSLAAIPANLLAEPAVAPATILGVITAAVAPFWVAGARVIAWFGALPCRWLALIAHTFARLPGAAVHWPSGMVGALDLVFVMALFALGLRLRATGRKAVGSVRAGRRSGVSPGHGMLAIVPTATEVSPVIVVIGDEELLVERAVGAAIAVVRAADPQADVSQLPGAELEPGQLAELTSPSLFGEQRVLVIRDVEQVGKGVVDELLAACRDAGDDVRIVLVHKGGARGKAVVDAALGLGGRRVDCVKLSRPGERIEFVRGEFRALDRVISEDGARALLDAVGNDLRELAAACAQLGTDTEGRVDSALVARYYRGRAEAGGFAVADRAIEGRLGDALEQLRWALAVGTAPVLIASALAQGVRALAKVASVPRGLRGADLARELGMPPWKIDRVKSQLRGWRPAGVAASVQAIAAADAQVKGGGTDAVYALEKAIMTIVTARGLDT